jgi:hypothetical protein
MRTPRTPVPSTRHGEPVAAHAVALSAAADPLRHALWLSELDAQLRPLLPADLAPHVRLGDVRGARLVMFAASAAWQTRLRHVGASVLASARSLGLEVHELRVRLLPPPAPLPPAPAVRAGKAEGHALADIRGVLGEHAVARRRR